MKTTILAAALWSIASYAHAAEKTMPIDFVGEWCTPSEEGDRTVYTLPSWTEDGKCTDILAVEKWGFSLKDPKDGKEKTCIPVAIRLKSDTAPSGTAYMATINANCTPDGVQTRGPGPLRTFEFERYKGRLMVKSK